MRRQFVLILFSLFIGILALGCGMSLSNGEKGTELKEIPKVEGADKPYEMPKLESSTPEDIKTSEK
jgi:hypothetical protein